MLNQYNLMNVGITYCNSSASVVIDHIYSVLSLKVVFFDKIKPYSGAQNQQILI